MERNIKMTIKVPEDMEEDFRVFIVTHGGAIISCNKEVEGKHGTGKELDERRN